MLDSKTAHRSYGGLKLLGGFWPQLLREIVYLAPTLGRDKRFLDGEEGAPPKVLEAYTGEEVV